MFEKASRLKVRFPYKGLVSIEDLWEIPLSELDSIYRGLVREQKDQEEESLLSQRTEKDSLLALKIDLVRYIVEVRLKEADETLNRFKKKAQQQKILEIIQKKREEELFSKPVEDLEKLLEDLV